jgi:hypothetical protein
MNRTQRLVSQVAAAVALVAAGSAAFAQEATYDYPTPITSSVSRADVRAEAAQALRAGTTIVGEASGVEHTPATSVVSRARVMAEAAEARRLGLSAIGERSVVASVEQERAIQVAGERTTGQVLASAQR